MELNGSATFTCNDGIWEVDQTNATCATVANASIQSGSSDIIPGDDVIIDILHTEITAYNIDITVTDSGDQRVPGVTWTPEQIDISFPKTIKVTLTLPYDIGIGNYNITVTLIDLSNGSTISISNPIPILVRSSMGCDSLTTTSWGLSCAGVGVPSAPHGTISSLIDNTDPGSNGFATFTCNDGTWEAEPSSICTNEVFNNFGTSVEIDGRRTIVGGQEGVHIYDTINEDGTLQNGVLLSKTSDIDIDSAFGFSVKIDGDYAIVSAPLDDNARGEDAGSAYIYERHSGENWIGPIALSLSNLIEADSQFGASIAIDGNTAIVGAPYDDNGNHPVGVDAGRAYIYERSSITGRWLDPAPLPVHRNFATTRNSQSGSSIAVFWGLHNSRWAPIDDNDESTDAAGSAYIYERIGGNFDFFISPTPLTLPFNLASNSRFGSAVAMDGNYAIVGAPGDAYPSGENTGRAYIYERNSDGWNNPIHLTLPELERR